MFRYWWTLTVYVLLLFVGAMIAFFISSVFLIQVHLIYSLTGIYLVNLIIYMSIVHTPKGRLSVGETQQFRWYWYGIVAETVVQCLGVLLLIALDTWNTDCAYPLCSTDVWQVPFNIVWGIAHTSMFVINILSLYWIHQHHKTLTTQTEANFQIVTQPV